MDMAHRCNTGKHSHIKKKLNIFFKEKNHHWKSNLYNKSVFGKRIETVLGCWVKRQTHDQAEEKGNSDGELLILNRTHERVNTIMRNINGFQFLSDKLQRKTKPLVNFTRKGIYLQTLTKSQYHRESLRNSLGLWASRNCTETRALMVQLGL